MWAGNKGLFACLVAFELIFAEMFGSINLANIGGFHLFLPSIFRGLVCMASQVVILNGPLKSSPVPAGGYMKGKLLFTRCRCISLY